MYVAAHGHVDTGRRQSFSVAQRINEYVSDAVMTSKVA